LYNLYNLKRMSPLGLLTPGMFKAGARAASKGFLPKSPGSSDPWQLPGVVMMQRGGEVVFANPAPNAYDHMSAEAILAAAKEHFNAKS